MKKEPNNTHTPYLRNEAHEGVIVGVKGQSQEPETLKLAPKGTWGASVSQRPGLAPNSGGDEWQTGRSIHSCAGSGIQAHDFGTTACSGAIGFGEI